MALLYDTPDAWISAPEKRLSVFGMSGLGKTRLASLMREAGDWFHYSIDYRIGTAYMGEHITDNLKRQAMQVPFLADLLRSDSIYIGSNITFGNLAPLSTFLGKPGDTARGGLPFEEYMRRQDLHRRAEIKRAARHAHLHLAGARHLWLSPCDLRHRRVDLRGGGPRGPRRPGAVHPRGKHADALDRRYRGAPRRTDPALRSCTEAHVLPPGFPRAALAGVSDDQRRGAGGGGPGCLRALRLCPRARPPRAALRPPWRGTGASASPPPRSRRCATHRTPSRWSRPPLADMARPPR